MKVLSAVATTNRAVSDVAAEHGLSWWTVYRMLIAAAAAALPDPAPAAVLGIDETQTRRSVGCSPTVPGRGPIRG